jgi:hypothetical protein
MRALLYGLANGVPEGFREPILGCAHGDVTGLRAPALEQPFAEDEGRAKV